MPLPSIANGERAIDSLAEDTSSRFVDSGRGEGAGSARFPRANPVSGRFPAGDRATETSGR